MATPFLVLVAIVAMLVGSGGVFLLKLSLPLYGVLVPLVVKWLNEHPFSTYHICPPPDHPGRSLDR